MDTTGRFALGQETSFTKENCSAAPLLRAAPGCGVQDSEHSVIRRLGPVPHSVQEGILYHKGAQINSHTWHPHAWPHVQHEQVRLDGERQGRFAVFCSIKKRAWQYWHRHNLPQLHQAARHHRLQDAGSGRRHRHAGRQQVSHSDPERRIHCVVRSIMPGTTQWCAILPVRAPLLSSFDGNGPKIASSGKYAPKSHSNTVQKQPIPRMISSCKKVRIRFARCP